MKIYFILFYILLIASGTYSQSNKLTDDSVKYYSEKAIHFYNEKKYEVAIKYCDSVLIRDPKNVDMINKKAGAQLLSGDNAGSKRSFDYILENNLGNRKVALIGKGIAESNLLRYKQSILDFIEVLKLDSLNGVAYYYLGYNSFYLQDYNKALINLKKANKIRPNDFETVLYLGETYLVKQHPDSAIYYLDKAEELNDKSEYVHMGKANALYMLKKYDRSKAELIKANKMEETYDAYLMLGNIYDYEGKNDSLNEMLVKLKQFNVIREDGILLEVRFLIKVKDYKNSLEKINNLIMKKPVAINESYYLRGKIYEGLNDYKSALNEFTYIEKINPSYPSIILDIGFCYENLQNIDSALYNYKRFTIANPSNTEGLYFEGKLLYNMKKYDEAKENFVRILRYKESADVYDYLVNISLVNKNYKDALQYSEKGSLLTIKGYENEYKLNADKVISLLMLKEYKMAFDVIDNYQPENYASLLSMRVFKCISLFGMEEFEKIDELMKQFTYQEINSNAFLIKMKLFCLLNNNNYDEWIRLAYNYCDNSYKSTDSYQYFYNPASKTKTDNSNYEIVGSKYFLKKNADTAISFSIGYINNPTHLSEIFNPLINKLIESANKHSKNEIIYLIIAQLKSGLREEDAIEFYNKAIEKKPDYCIAFYLRGMYKKEVKGDIKSAEDDFKMAYYLGYNDKL